MNESDFLKNFAKVLGAETKFEEIEEKRQKEKRMLESLGARFGVDLKEEEVKEVPVTFIQQPVVEEEVTVPELIEEVFVHEPVKGIVENVIPPLPQLPVETIVSKSVEMISKATDTQSTVNKIDDPLRREIEAMKKSIADFHRFAARHSQMGGGGAGDIVNLDMYTTSISSDYSVGRKDYYIGVDTITAVTITLPTKAKNGRVIVIKDETGLAQTNPITVHGTIDNDTGGFILQINNGGIQMIYRNGWRII